MLKLEALAITLLTVFLTPMLPAQPGFITTVAGNGSAGTAGVGGPAVNAQMGSLGGICVDRSDNLYIADTGNNRVVRVDAASGLLTLVAGSGQAGYAGDGGPATQALLNSPRGVALDPAGNLYISDTTNSRIRRVDAVSGLITTVVGNGVSAFAGDGGPAAGASISAPMAINFDPAGNLYIADMRNNRIRRVDGQSGIITTVAGNGSSTSSPDGAVAVNSSISSPFWVSLDHSGNLLFSEMGSARIRSVNASTGLLGTVAGNGGSTYNGDGEPATSAAIGMSPGGVVDPAGNLYFADFTGRIRRVDAVTGQILTVAGNGSGAQEQVSTSGGGGSGGCYSGPLGGDNDRATYATIDGAFGLAMTQSGDLLLSDWIDCRVRRVFLPSPYAYTNTTIAASTTTPLQGQPVVFTATVAPINASGIPTGSVLFFNQPQGLGATILGQAALNNGTATLQVNTMQVELAYNIVAYYAGDTSFNGSGSAGLTVTVTPNNKPMPIVSLATSQNPALLNAPVTFTINVAPPPGNTNQPTGTVRLNDGPTAVGSGTLANGQVQITVSFSTAGSRYINVIYQGDSNFNAATTAGIYETIQPGATTITLTSNTPSPSNYYQPITISATISPSNATGTVNWYDNGTPLAIYPVSNGSSAVNGVVFSAGSHVITATYLGDANNGPSTSNAVTQVVNKITPTVTVTVDQNPAVAPATVNFTVRLAQVSDGAPIQLLDGQTVIATGADHGPGATFAISTLTPGIHSITAAVTGDINFNPATSNALSESIQSRTTVSLSSQASSTTYLQPVTLTATISPSVTAGTVQFTDGATNLGTAPVAAGVATLTTSTLAAGSHPIVATYSGDSVYLTSQSSAWTQTVSKASPTLALASSLNPSDPGVAVTLTATLSAPSATGSVQFLDGTTVLGTSNVAAGSAAFTTSSLAAGSHSITAIYSGDGNFNGFTSPAVTQVVRTPTATTLSSNINPSVVGGTIVLSGVVNSSTATGTMQFLDGTTSLGSATVANGGAALSLSGLAAGSHSITAVYSGDPNFGPGASAVLVQVVKPATSTTIATDTPSPVFGQAITLLASVTPAAATGTVQFVDGSTPLGTSTLSSGNVALPVATLSTGSHSISASYSGDSTYASSTSATMVVTIGKATPAVTAASSLNPSVAGQPVTFTASISPSGATGTVQFLDGSTVLGSSAVSSGAAAFSTPALAAGTHTITASYTGDANYNAVAATIAQIVKAATTTGLSANNTSITAGQAVQLTAAISPTAATGTVQFLDGATALGTVPVGNGAASLSVSTLGVGSHSITAAYSGDANDAGSTSAAVAVTVSKAGATVAVTSSPNPSVAGQSVTFTASVSPGAATGTVQFLDGATALGTAAVNSGMAAFSTSALAAGSHTITASYSGDASYNAASSIATQTVQAVSSTTLSVNPTSAAAGQTVQLSASVSPAAATGTVQFLDGATVLGAVTVSSGAASLAISTLAVGSHNLSAVYSGDANDAASTSATIPFIISKITSSVVAASSLNPSVAGQSVTFTATVSPGAATGTVQFLDGATVLGAATLSGGTATLTTSALAAGAHTILAAYGGDANYNSSSAGIAQTVKAVTAATLSANPPSPAFGQAVQLTVSVSPGTATGTAQFLDGATLLGTAAVSGGAASLSVATFAVGSHSLTAVYSGDANDTSSTSSVLALTVSKAGAAVALSSSLNPSVAGQPVTFTAAVSPSAATGTVQFLDGSTVLGAATLSSGTATLTTSALTAGAHTITGSYSGSATYNAASSSLAQTVKTVSTITLSAGSTSPTFGQADQLTASVSPAAATGTVQFFDGSTSLGTSAVSGGSASLPVSTLVVGSHSLTAVYSGDANDTSSTSTAVAVNVKKASPTVSMSSSLNPSVSGQAVTFTATVVPSAATGSIQFKDGGSVIGTVTLTSGSAVYSTSTLAVGNHSMTASYTGDSNVNSGQSSSLSQIVNAPPPGAPSNLTAAAASSSQINLSWTASPTSGVKYNVYASTTSGFTPSSSNRIANNVNSTTYSNTGLSPSTTYYYLVTAQNSGGESSPTNQAGATTAAPGISCHVAYSVTTQWSGGFGTAITIQNTGSTAINGWSLTWTWAGNQQITQSWNSDYSQNGASATLTNASWNATIGTGATISGMGFNASFTGSNHNPTAFYVNGTLCH